MAFETVHLFQQVELDTDTEGDMTFEFSTDVPGDALTIKHTEIFNTDRTTPKRRTVNIRLPGTTRGKVYKGRISGAFVCRLFGARVFAKPIGKPEPTGWNWYPLPMEGTAELYSETPLPIEPTAEPYQETTLPIVGTAEEYSQAALPIVPTPEGWTDARLPMPQPGVIPRWVDLALDAIE